MTNMNPSAGDWFYPGPAAEVLALAALASAAPNGGSVRHEQLHRSNEGGGADDTTGDAFTSFHEG